MAKTIEQLKAQSAEIKNATSVGENTATRVGTLFNDIVEHVEEYEVGQTANTEANAKAIAEEKAAIMGTDRIADGAVTIKKIADSSIDDEPTDGSENIVKSGGVYNAIGGKISISKTLEVKNGYQLIFNSNTDIQNFSTPLAIIYLRTDSKASLGMQFTKDGVEDAMMITEKVTILDGGIFTYIHLYALNVPSAGDADISYEIFTGNIAQETKRANDAEEKIGVRIDDINNQSIEIEKSIAAQSGYQLIWNSATEYPTLNSDRIVIKKSAKSRISIQYDDNGVEKVAELTRTLTFLEGKITRIHMFVTITSGYVATEENAEFEIYTGAYADILFNFKQFDEYYDLMVSLPSVIYLRTSQQFSIWYRNVILGSKAFKDGYYSIKCQKKVGNNYERIGTNCAYDLFNYVPSEVEEFDLEIRIIENYTEEVVFSKVIHFIVKNPAAVVNRSPKIVIIGDSFTDEAGVSKWIYTFLENDNFTPVSIGVNSANYKDYKDDAWSGMGLNFFYNYPFGYHRSDRDPKDDIVVEGVTYTRNEFVQDWQHKFDFTYYMNRYFTAQDKPDCVVLNAGLNDIIWHPYDIETINKYIGWIKNIISSIHDYNANIKIILCTVTPQPEKDAFTSSYGTSDHAPWLTAEQAKARQEKWNQRIIDEFDTPEYRNNMVFIAPTSANFDTNNVFPTTVTHPNKFDNSIEQTIVTDIHPTQVGAKFIADTIVNTIEGVL